MVDCSVFNFSFKTCFVLAKNDQTVNSYDAVRPRKFVLDFEEDVFSIDDLVLSCKVCGIKIASAKQCAFQQRTASAKHLRPLQRKDTRDKATALIFISDKHKKKNKY